MNRERALKVVLVIVGLLFVAGIYPLVLWEPHHEIEQMLLGVYVTLGIFLLLASRNPSAHFSLIAFTAWSSLVHAGIMALQATRNVEDRGHLLGGTALFVIIALPLLFLLPSKVRMAAP